MKDNQPAIEAGTGSVALRFTGRAGEYFSIWIVNLCLSILTLGIYSAWAKVRRKRYFYGNTTLDGGAFDYRARPFAILKGRLIVFAAFVAYSVAERVNPVVAAILFLVFLAATPWIVVRALRFNAVNTAYRNVRFGFGGSYGGLVVSVGLPALLAFLTLGLAFPYFLYKKDRYILEHSSYGATRFSFDSSAGRYYLASLKVFLAGLAFIVGSVITIGIGLVPFYVLARAYAVATMARLRWESTSLSELRFECAWTTWGLFKLYLINALAVIVSFGLLVPWAAIRTARYTLEGLSLRPREALGAFVASSEAQVASVGEEAGELLGFDLGL